MQTLGLMCKLTPILITLSRRATQDFVVRTLVLKYKLVGGRYQRDHSRLDCTSTSRFIVDTYFDQLLAQKAS